MTEVLYPVTEVAEMWRCSRDYVYELIARGELRTVNLPTGGKSKTRVSESALADFVKRNTNRLKERTA